MKIINIHPKIKIPIAATLWLALGIFMFVGITSAVIFPHIAEKLAEGSKPTILQLSITGLFLIFITFLFLKYVGRMIKLDEIKLALTLGFISLFLLAKFILSPYLLYFQEIHTGFGVFDPNNGSKNLFVAAGAIIFTIFILSTIYSAHKLEIKSISNLKFGAKVENLIRVFALPLGILLFYGIVLAGYLDIHYAFLTDIRDIFYHALLPVFFFHIYLFDIFNVGSNLVGLFAIFIATALIVCIATFHEIKREAINLKNASLLASFFWIMVCLAVAYNVIWVVYINTLASIWTFKTVK